MYPHSKRSWYLQSPPRLLLRFSQAQMEPHVGNKDIQVGVAVIVSYGEPHPVADSAYAHLISHGDEPGHAGGGIVPEHLEPVAVIRQPQVGVAVVVMIEEEDSMGPGGGVADAISPGVFCGRVVALILTTSGRVTEQQRAAILVTHGDLPRRAHQPILPSHGM